MTFVVKCAPILKNWNFCLCSCSLRRANIVLGWHRLICVVALCLLQTAWLLKIGEPLVLNKIVSLSSKGTYETIPEELLISSLITTVIYALLCCTLLFGIYTNRAAFIVPHLLMELLIISVFTLSAVVLSSLNLAMKNIGLGMAFFLGGCVCIVMDVLLQHHEAKRIYPVPEGLKELCTDISREVLRSQPSNIHGFIAEYLEALLISRDNARVVARILSEILDETVSYESAWKRRGLTMEEVTHAAIIIQAAYRGFITRRTLRALPSELENLLFRCGVSWSVANRVCSIIQAAYRGHLARKRYRSRKVTCELLEKLGIGADVANAACIIIQSAFRGYQARNYVKHRTVPADVTGLTADERLLLNRFMVRLNIRWSQANIAAISIQNAYNERVKYLTEKEAEGKESTEVALRIISSLILRATESDRDKKTHLEESTEVALRIVSSLILRATEPDYDMKTRIGEPIIKHDASESKKITEEILNYIVSEAMNQLLKQETDKLVKNFGIDEDAANKACTVIQAAYRGHLARRYVKEHTVPQDRQMDPEERLKMNRDMISMDIKWNETNDGTIDLQDIYEQRLATGYKKGESEEQLEAIESTEDQHLKKDVMFKTDKQGPRKSGETLQEELKAESPEGKEVEEGALPAEEHEVETESRTAEEEIQPSGDETTTEETKQPPDGEATTEEIKPSGDEAATEETKQPSGDEAATEETKQPSGDETVTEETKQPSGDETVTEETKQPSGDETVTDETKQPSGDGTVTEETKQPSGDETVTEETKQPAGDETVTEETKQPSGEEVVTVEEEKVETVISVEEHTEEVTAPPDEGQTEPVAEENAELPSEGETVKSEVKVQTEEITDTDTEQTETVTSSTEPPSTTEPEDSEAEE